MKQQLIFDPNISNYKENHDIVGNIQLDKDGNVITAGNGSSDNVASTFNAQDVRSFLFAYDSVGGNWDRLRLTNGSLDVNITSPISLDVNLTQADEITVFQGTSPWLVSATDLDIRNLTFATDKVDASGSSVSITGDVNVTQGTSPWVVSATDFDIRNLTFATDAVDVSGSSVSISGSVAVTSTDLDIRNLAYTQDSVSNWDIRSSVLQSQNTVGATEEAIVASSLANRREALIMNNSKSKMWVGAPGVTSADGFPLLPGYVLELKLGASAVLNVIGETAGQDLRVLELA